MPIRNLEGIDEYDVVWTWEHEEPLPGMTAVLRVKNEARNLPFVLPPLFDAVDHVVIVDNQSTDGSAHVARDTAAQLGVADRLTIADYPFDVSRCGSEHLVTPVRSVHSLTHFYNWSFAKVRTSYSMKWDGDMVLTREGVAAFAALAWRFAAVEAIATMPRHPLYVESDRVAHLDLGSRNAEPWVYPMGPDYQFNKAFEWELRGFPERAHMVRLPEGLCVELKHLDSDEFSHWTGAEDFSRSPRTERKRREWEIFTALRNGRGDVLDDVVRIEAPAGTHIIDHVCGAWLPSAPRPLVGKTNSRRP